MNAQPRLSCFFLVALFAYGASTTVGTAASPEKGSVIRTLQKVRPAFQIAPLVLDYEARRGKQLTFQFDVEAFGQETTLHVRPVSLRQEENGVIMPDEKAPAPDVIRLDTPAELHLRADTRASIRGRLRVPATDSTFHSFGILVKDLGRKQQDERPDRRPGEHRLGIRFVTQYLLRCDIRVTGTRGSQISDLEVVRGELIDRDGFAHTRVIVHNPTPSPVEFQLRCRVDEAGSSQPRKTFPAMLPVRASLDEPERFVARILPGSTVRMESRVPHPVFAGEHTLATELHWRGRQHDSAAFALDIAPHAFAAQQASIVQVGRDVTVAPTQLELSLQRGGKRFVALALGNRRAEAVKVRISDDSDGEWLRVRPSQVELRPGATRKVLLSIDASKQPSAHAYARLNVQVETVDGQAVGQHRLPVGLLVRTPGAATLEPGDVRWTDALPHTAILPLENTGDQHAALNARLYLTDEFGRTMFVPAGFGRWLLPGKATELRFPLNSTPPPGRYNFRITHGEPTADTEPLVKGQVMIGSGAGAE